MQKAEFGIADDNRGIPSTFFDYDRYGNLDLCVANAPDFQDKGTEIIDLTSRTNFPPNHRRDVLPGLVMEVIF